MMFTFHELFDVARQIRYKDWALVLHQINDNTSLIQWTFYDLGVRQYARKWVVDHDQPISDVVRTAMFAVITAEEHEARERFYYKDKKIFGPHFDVNRLVELAGKKENLEIPVSR